MEVLRPPYLRNTLQNIFTSLFSAEADSATEYIPLQLFDIGADY